MSPSPRPSTSAAPPKGDWVLPAADFPNVLPADAVVAIPEVLAVTPPGSQLPAVVAAEPFPQVVPADDGPGLSAFALLLAVWNGITSACEWVFGVATLVVGLAMLASLPILQFLSLGYLLEAGGRVARSGRFRDGFPGVRKAARVGSIVLGTTLVLLPLRLVSSFWVSAQVIDPGGPTARAWKFGLTILTVLVGLHVAVACSRGGKLRYFFWPFNFIWLIRRLWRGGYYAASRDAVWDFAIGLRLPYYFWLGLRGFVGGFVWLAVPVSLIALGRVLASLQPSNPQGTALGFGGAFLLMFVLLYVPILQVRFACENRFRTLFDVPEARRTFNRAPWAFAFSFLITLLFAVPLLLLKIELVPRETAFLPGIVFIAFIFPARLLTGWALGRARKRVAPRHWFFRWTGRLSMVPITMMFVIIVYFSQFISWHGVWSLYEQHAFLLPVPFVGM